MAVESRAVAQAGAPARVVLTEAQAVRVAVAQAADEARRAEDPDTMVEMETLCTLPPHLLDVC